MTGLPASSAEHPRTRLLRILRPVAAQVMGRRWSVTVHHPELVPSSGGVILAANHVGLLDGPLLATYAPRPVHALTKQEMFDGRLGGFLRGTGQIPLDRHATDPGAVRTALRVVRGGGAWRTTQQAWPRTREHVAATSVLLKGHMLSELDSALSQTRRSKPWPLPAGQFEDDPDTGLVEHPQRTVDTHE